MLIHKYSKYSKYSKKRLPRRVSIPSLLGFETTDQSWKSPIITMLFSCMYVTPSSAASLYGVKGLLTSQQQSRFSEKQKQNKLVGAELNIILNFIRIPELAYIG